MDPYGCSASQACLIGFHSAGLLNSRRDRPRKSLRTAEYSLQRHPFSTAQPKNKLMSFIGSAVFTGIAAQRMKRQRLSLVQAVTSNDSHTRAIEQWLKEFVIGMGFCPWAETASDAGGIRIVTSTGTSLDDVISDLVEEARMLRDASLDAATTTILVCPHVLAWANFSFFNAFYVWNLDNGFALAEDFGVKVVPFHPSYTLKLEPAIRVGESISIPTPDGHELRGKVLDEYIGPDESGETCFLVMLEDGKEVSIRHAAIMGGTLGEGDSCKDLASRAPRPLLHLLRTGDLDRAVDEAGGNTEELLERNECRSLALGEAGLEELLARCG